MNRIFISYAHSDASEVAEFLYKRLSECGYNVWKDDHNMPLGTNFPSALSEALEQERDVILVLTGAALRSEWVNDEIDMALAARRRVIPILLEEIPQEDVPLKIRKLNWLVMRDGVDDWKALDRLVNNLEGGSSIPRVYNLSKHEDIPCYGVLVLGHCGSTVAELESPASVTEKAVELAIKAMPYIKAGAGIVPNGLSPIALTTLAFLLGKNNQMPKIYYPAEDSEGKYGIHKDIYIPLQEIRRKGQHFDIKEKE